MEQLAACLSETLSGERTARIGAEQVLVQSALPKNDPNGELGVQLATILQSANVAVSLRQAAGVALRAYVYERWGVYFETFMKRARQAGDPSNAALPLEAKQQIRSFLFLALGDASRKIRLLAAQLLSLISTSDFPDHFPELSSSLQGYLSADPSTDGAAKVDGALKFLADLVQDDVDENQLMVVAEQFMPSLLAIVQSSRDDYTFHIKARCFFVFRQCLTSMHMLEETNPDAVENALNRFLGPWLDAMQHVLAPRFYAEANWEAESTWEVLGLRREVYRCLSTAARFKSYFSACRIAFMERTLADLEALVPLFTQVDLTKDPRLIAARPAEEDTDVSADISDVGVAAFNFFTEVIRVPLERDLAQIGGGSDAGGACLRLLRLLGVYSQMTVEDEDEWENDAEAFVAEDDEENLAVTLRTVTTDLFEHVLGSTAEIALPLLANLAQQTKNDADARSELGDPAWWKGVESYLLLLGASHSSVQDSLLMDGDDDDDSAPLKITDIFKMLVLPYLSMSAPSFLHGRCFVFASQYADDMDDQLAHNVFLAAIHATQEPDETAPLHLKLSAVRTMRNFGNIRPEVIGPAANTVVLQLGPLLLRAKGNTLVLIIDAVEAAVAHDEGTNNVDFETLGHLARAAIEAWRINLSNPEVEMSVGYLLESLIHSAVGGVPQQTMSIAVPAVLEKLHDPEGAKISADTSAASLIRSILRAASPEVMRDFVPAIFPSAIEYLMGSRDPEASQNLIYCLTTMCQKSAAELLKTRDEHGTTALDMILRVVERQMSLEDDEGCTMPLGILLTTLFVQAGAELSPVMPALVQALASKLVVTKSSGCKLALLFPLAYLFAEHTAAVVSLLAQSTVAEPEGGDKRALDAVVTVWLDEFEHVHRPFVMNVHILGLTHLFDKWPSFLNDLVVNGEAIHNDTDLIITRSRAKTSKCAHERHSNETVPTEYERIPACAALLKLLLAEYDEAADGGDSGDEENGSAVEDDVRSRALVVTDTQEDGEWNDEPDAPKAAQGMNYRGAYCPDTELIPQTCSKPLGSTKTSSMILATTRQRSTFPRASRSSTLIAK